MAGILVIAESVDGALAPISGELIGAAKKLSAEGAGSVTALVAGDAALAQGLIAAGADNAIAATNANLATGTADAYVPAVEAAVAQTGADIILLRATRSAYGGTARAEVGFKNPPAVATVKAKSFDAPEGAAGSGSVSTVDAAGEPRVKVTGTSKAESTGIRIEDAPVVVAGGRGLGDEGAFRMLEELSTLLKGATGASRAACDLGWYPPSQQVGLTGKTVSPNLYIAIAISGASQHMAGMAGSKNIVAINKDADANMVKVSKFAIVDDYKKVVPALIEEIKKLG